MRHRHVPQTDKGRDMGLRSHVQIRDVALVATARSTRTGSAQQPNGSPGSGGRSVSEENVELVLMLQEAIAERDFVQLFRDDYVWGRFTETVAPLFHPDFESANVLLGVETTYQGVDGLRAIWLDWLQPWASYRARVERIIDCGDRVAVVVRVSACPLGSTKKVMLNSAFVFTLRDGKIVRCEGYPDRAEGLEAVGLVEEIKEGPRLRDSTSGASTT